MWVSEVQRSANFRAARKSGGVEANLRLLLNYEDGSLMSLASLLPNELGFVEPELGLLKRTRGGIAEGESMSRRSR